MPTGSIVVDPSELGQPPTAAGTITVDPSEIDAQPSASARGMITVDPSQTQSSGPAMKMPQPAPAKTYSLSDLASRPSRTSLPARSPLIAPSAEPDVDAIKKKYGLPQQTDLTKGFFDQANGHLSGRQAENFGNAVQELRSFSPVQP